MKLLEFDSFSLSDAVHFHEELNPELFDGIILPKISHYPNDFIHTGEAIGDIKNAEYTYIKSNIKVIVYFGIN